MKTIKSFKSLVAFEKVAKHKSYSIAAKELNVSKAHISKLIQELEDLLEQRLFNRSTRVVELTQTGQKLYQTCSKSFQEINLIQDEILNKSATPSGRLKISVAGVFGEEYITPFVLDYLKRYPKVQIDLVFEERVVDLFKESYDFAIRVGHLRDSSLIAKKIAVRKEYICATPTYLSLNGLPQTPEDLKNHNCLGLKDSWNFIIAKKKTNIQIKGSYRSNNARTLIQATLSDLGFCYLPKEYVQPYLDNGELISVLEEYLPNETPIWIISPSNKNNSLNAKTFIQELSEVNFL